MQPGIDIKILLAMLLIPLGLSAKTENQLSILLDKLENLEQQLAQGENDSAGNRLAFSAKELKIATIDSSISEIDRRASLISQGLNRTDDYMWPGAQTEDVAALALDIRSLVSELRGSVEKNSMQNRDIPLNNDADSKLSPISISGFGDFSYAATQETGESGNLALGQAEIDLESAYDDKIVMTAAIAFDPEEKTFGLGQFTIDFQLIGTEEDHFRKAKGIDHAGIVVGQFDVPFGLDWKVYPSIDRKTISGPLVVENTHDFWNDYGVQAYVENRWFNAVAFGTNGFGYDEVEINHALGGRLGIKPHAYFELGSSYAGFFNGSRDLDMYLLGFDVQFQYGALSLKGEFITRETGLTNALTATDNGFYGQAYYDFGKFFITGRYDRFSQMELAESDNSRLSVGGGLVVMEGVELRLEHQLNSIASDATFMQVVVGF